MINYNSNVSVLIIMAALKYSDLKRETRYTCKVGDHSAGLLYVDETAHDGYIEGVLVVISEYKDGNTKNTDSAVYNVQIDEYLHARCPGIIFGTQKYGSCSAQLSEIKKL